jgi:putative lipoic acid-binding regulatory protein
LKIPQALTTADAPSLIEYPCDFPIKIVGRVDGLPVKPMIHPKREAIAPPLSDDPSAMGATHRRQDFIQGVLMIVKRHASDFDEASLEFKISKRNTYLSLTCTIRAISRAQLDALYQELYDHPMAVMVL